MWPTPTPTSPKKNPHIPRRKRAAVIMARFVRSSAVFSLRAGPGVFIGVLRPILPLGDGCSGVLFDVVLFDVLFDGVVPPVTGPPPTAVLVLVDISVKRERRACCLRKVKVCLFFFNSGLIKNSEKMRKPNDNLYLKIE